MTEYVIFETTYFRVEQSYEISIPGYLIVSMKESVSDFSCMSEESAIDLGRAIHKACKRIERVIKPEKVYVAKFGEQCEQIHFHILPRTKWLLEEYKRELGMTDEPVSGPLIFEWVRNTYRTKRVSRESEILVYDAIEQMRLI